MTTAKEKGSRQAGESQIPEELAIMPSRGDVVYPTTIAPFATDDEKMTRLIDDVVAGDKILGLFAMQSPEGEVSADNLHDLGTAIAIVRMLKMPDGSIRASRHSNRYCQDVENAGWFYSGFHAGYSPNKD